jgi:transcriptional regulator with XRE-family HTH domain
MYMTITLKIGENLKKCRELSGLTQKEVEAKLSLRSLTIRDYESERIKLPAAVAIRLAELYQVSLEQLLGATGLPDSATKPSLGNFASLFETSSFGMVLFDPLLRAHFEELQDKAYDFSLFEIITWGESKENRKAFVEEVCRYIFSLAGRDRKFSQEESMSIRMLLRMFRLSGRYDELSRYAASAYLPKTRHPVFASPAAVHFAVWLLFIFATCDHEVTYQESQYIEDVAQNLRMNKSNFKTIKRKFLGGEA